MYRFYFLLALLLIAANSWAQTAPVQVIHNSADPNAAVVDIYLDNGDSPAISDLGFREATTFIDLPAGVEITIGVAPGNSTGPGDIIASFPLTLTADIPYVVMATGVLNPADFDESVNTSIAFTLAAYENARTSDNNAPLVDLLAYHGATDAPMVDVVVGGLPLVDDVSYGMFDGYYVAEATKYILNVTPADQNDVIVGSFLADLSGLEGSAAVVFASGFLVPGANQDGAPFGLFAALPDGTVVTLEPVVAPTVVINEVDYDQIGPDEGEFIELYNPGDAAASLFGSTLEFINGGTGDNYQSIALPDISLEAGSFYTICFGNNTADYCDITVAGSIQNGGPDAFYLAFQGQAFDVLSYEGDVPGFVEGSGEDLEDIASISFGSLSRLPDGADTDQNNVDFRLQCATPGMSNASADFSCFTANAQVQVIHNSPTPGSLNEGPLVDIYLNGLLIPELTGVPYRAATAFLDLPAGIEIEAAVAASPSTSVADAIATFPLGTLAANEKYIIIANGIVGNADTPFSLEVKSGARTMANSPGNVDILAFHGAADAPNVDIDARAVGTLIENLPYGSFSDEYLELPPSLYYLDVRVAGDPGIVATFEADISGLTGNAATIFASGLLGDTPGFGLFAAFPDGTVVELPQTEVARLQVIHNSPSPIVDVYANGDLLIPDFEFRTATPFLFVPAGVMIDLAVAPGNSGSAADAIANFEVQFENGSTYVVVANGIVGDAGYPFTLEINDMGREAAASPENVDIAVFHGSPGAPNVDVDARLVGTLFGDVQYGEFTNYLPVGSGLYYLDIRPTGSADVVATFEADLTGLAGGAATVFASGLLDGSPAFGLFAALPDGTVVALPATGAARIQIIHASPTGTVDVYINGGLALDNFEYLTATPYLFLRSDTPYDFAVAPENSSSVADAIYTAEDVILTDRETYAAVAAGVVADGNFGIFVAAGFREIGTSATEVDARIFHGISDAPAVDVTEVSFETTLASDLAFGDFSDYASLAPIPNVFDLFAAGTEDVVGSFFFNLTGGQTLATTIIATGTLGADDFNLHVVLTNGAVLSMIPVAQAQFVHNSPDPAAPVVDVYGNDGLFLDDFAFLTGTPFTYVPSRTPISFGIAPGNSTGPDDIILSLPDPVTFDIGKKYEVFAAGLVGDADAPFDLYVYDAARTSVETPGTSDILVFHGATDAPGVDVTARAIGDLVDNIQFGEYAGYLTVTPAPYFLEVRADGSDDLVATFAADLSGAADIPIVVFAAGFVGSGTPPFGLYAALPDGTVVPLPPVAQVQVIHNSPTPTVDVYANGELLIPDFEFRTATPFVDLPTRGEIDLAIAPGDSQSAADAIYNLNDVVLEDGKVYIIMATGIVGDASAPFDLAITDMGRTRAASGAGTDLLLYHGAPDAPVVDVVVEGGSVLFDNVAYGDYQGYINVPASSYVLNVTPGDDNTTVVKAYEADLTGLEGGAATVFATGFLGSMDMDDAFGVWVALPDGTTFPLSELVGINELTGKVSDFVIAPNPVTTQTFVRYTLTESLNVSLNIYDANGRLLQSQYMGNQNPDTYTYDLDVRELPQGVYSYSIVTPKGILSKRFVVVR